MNFHRHPIDFDGYNRGDLIPIAVIRSAAEVDGIDVEDSDRLRLYMMGLKDLVQTHFLQRGESLPSIRIETKYGLRIMRDGDEQSAYCEEDLKRIIRRARRRMAEAMAVDVGKLSEGRILAHHEMLLRASRVIGAYYPRRKLPDLPRIEDVTDQPDTDQQEGSQDQ